VSRAFVREDASPEPEPEYDLPDPDAPGYLEAVARALLEGANVGDSRSAELATGYRWGSAELAETVRLLLSEAEEEGDDRLAQLARRFLRQAGVPS
jgi:hypothetical protein